MMGFDEFTENILKEIRARAGGSFHAMKQDVVKNNNVKLTGIAVMNEGAAIGPCVYLDWFYREYGSGGMKFSEAADEIYRLLIKHRDDMQGIDMSDFLGWETAKGNIYAKLVNAGQNEGELQKIPHRMFLDLAVVYYAVAVETAEQEIGTVLIRNEHMEWWGQGEADLYRAAMKNMRADGGADFASMETVVKRMMPGIALPFEKRGQQRDTGMYVLTNRRKRYGAAEILDRNTLRMIADQVGDGFIVLPSSVHETIVLPSKNETEYGWLADMVREVNDTQVDAEERLSYHVYVYSRDEGTLKIAA